MRLGTVVAATVKISVSWVVTLCTCSLTRNKISEEYTVKDAKDRSSTFLPIFGTDTPRFTQHVSSRRSDIHVSRILLKPELVNILSKFDVILTCVVINMWK